MTPVMSKKMYTRTFVITGTSPWMGGLLFGDDYFSWDGVRLAVDRFAKEHRKELLFVDDKWVLRKGSRNS